MATDSESQAEEGEAGDESLPSPAALAASLPPDLHARIQSLLSRWSAHLASRSPSLSFNPPASASDLHSLSSLIASTLPPSSSPPPSPSSPSFPSSPFSTSLSSIPPVVLSCLLTHDGQSFQSPSGLLGNFDLLSAHLIAQQYRTLCDLLAYGLIPQPAASSASSSSSVSRIAYSPHWLPVAMSSSGHCLCLDMTPGRGGGGVVAMEEGGLSRRFLIHSAGWESLLQRVVTCLEAGEWEWDSEQSMYSGAGSEGFCSVWQQGRAEWEAKQEAELRRYDESKLVLLTRDIQP